ncbi:cytochrome P450 4A5-like [Rhopilema esculentum]|uniref:cytochrome P450 4A5-like n=1 Tax=Rhopilema esculentum TaxID=499914 RepID=UPI0031D4DC2F|eukprot:gene12261-2902_t
MGAKRERIARSCTNDTTAEKQQQQQQHQHVSRAQWFCPSPFHSIPIRYQERMGFFWMLLVGVLSILLIVEILKWLRNFFTASQRSRGPDIPSPPAYPILRHMPYFLDNIDDDKKLLAWAESFKEEGMFVIDTLLGPKRICIFKEDFIKQVLVRNCTKYGRSKLLAGVFPQVKKGILLVNGKEHAWQRKMLNPSFSFSSLLPFVDVFDANADSLVQYWKEKAKSTLSGVVEADIHRDFTKLTLDVIGETAFGYNFNTLTTGENKVSQSVELILAGRSSVMARLIRRIIPFYDLIPFPENTKMKKAAEIVNGVVAEVIKNKREKLRNGGDPNGEISKDLLGKMILLQDKETGKTLSDEVIEAQVHTFMVAGHETTSVGLTWIFYLLAKHPAVQEKARGEAKAVLGSSTSVRSEDLDKLSYITAVINESLRMYPPFAVFMREALQDDVIGGYKIQKGSYILIPICVLHHMEENWPNHNDFRPERFLDAGEKQSEIGNYTFMPFSNGPRNCIGWKFAVMEMKVVVAKLLTTFKFELDPRQKAISTKLRLSLKPFPKPILRISAIEG